MTKADRDKIYMYLSSMWLLTLLVFLSITRYAEAQTFPATQPVTATRSLALQAALQDDVGDTNLSDLYHFGNQNSRQYRPFCSCLNDIKLNGGSFLPSTDSDKLLSCIQDIVVACNDPTTQNKIFSPAVCQTFQYYYVHMSAYGYVDEFTISAVPECAVDLYLDKQFQLACNPTCVPPTSHVSWNDANILWPGTDQIANHTFWNDAQSLPECGADMQPFDTCGSRGCQEVFNVYHEYHAANVTQCGFHNDMYIHRQYLQQSVLNTTCSIPSQQHANVTVSSSSPLGGSYVFNSEKWRQVLQSIYTTGYAAPLFRNRPERTIMAEHFVRHTSKICKHVYEYSRSDLNQFLKDIGTPQQIRTLFNGVDGKTLVTMNGMDLNALGVSPAWYIPFLSNKQTYFKAEPPRSFDLRGHASMIQVGYYVESIYDIDEEAYTFNAQFQVVFFWTDIDAWTTCKAEIMKDGSVVEESGDTCKHLWYPKLTVSFPLDMIDRR